ncbi:unnamed protein product [Cunninghamella blakesleeana]
MSVIPENIKINTRVQIDNDYATIKYIGEVEGSTGQWLGIEWDNDTRGKHDGSRSFIRYNTKKVSTGQPFLEALETKYADKTFTNEYDASKDNGLLYFGGNKNIVVETVGFEKVERKQSRIGALKIVGLSNNKISSAGNDQEIAKANLSIEDLDLSKNIFNDWNSVAKITNQLSQLKTICLNYIRLLPPPDDLLTPNNIISSPFSNLRTLVLCYTQIEWGHIIQLSPLLTQLEDLQLSGNGISLLNGNLSHLQNLKCINLENNKLKDWDQINHLNSLPNLEILFLNGNQLSRINILPNTFNKLEFLRVDHNNVEQWKYINMLNDLPSLKKLRCHENPVFQGLAPEVSAAQVIGRIKGLNILNGSALSSRDITDMERYYLKLCIQDGTSHESISKLHPRYLELCQVHGEPDLDIGKNNLKAASTLNDRLLNITLSHLPFDSEQALFDHQDNLSSPIKSIKKRVLATMVVRSLRNIIQKLFNIPAPRQHLYILQNVSGKQLLMDITDDLRDLKFYEVKNDDHIIILDF